jgi:beta-lactamase superfamily II metal-dependent hydrolase
MIIRTFHPVGQGAFYSEQSEKHLIVYDCGSIGHKSLAETVVANSFTPKKDIDCLFISHFDIDHINMIPILKANYNIKTVIMPLLHDNHKYLLANYYKALGLTKLASLIAHPKEFFENKAEIIAVKMKGKDENDENEANNREALQIDHLIEEIRRTQDKNGILKIKSGQKINIGGWMYIPHNIHYKERSAEFRSWLKLHKVTDFNKLSKDIQYVYDNKDIIKSYFNPPQKNVDRNINDNSMLLYSGPVDSNPYKYTLQPLLYCPIYKCSINRVGCIYTGDSDLKKSKIKRIYNKYWNNVGTIQIPHHGSIKNFSKEELDYNTYICPISFGTSNTHGHPSGKVITDLLQLSCTPIFVTEKLDSRYWQNIECF